MANSFVSPISKDFFRVGELQVDVTIDGQGMEYGTNGIVYFSRYNSRGMTRFIRDLLQ